MAAKPILAMPFSIQSKDDIPVVDKTGSKWFSFNHLDKSVVDENRFRVSIPEKVYNKIKDEAAATGTPEFKPSQNFSFKLYDVEAETKPVEIKAADGTITVGANETRKAYKHFIVFEATSVDSVL